MGTGKPLKQKAFLNILKNMKRPLHFPIHPFILAVYPFLFFCSQNRIPVFSKTSLLVFAWTIATAGFILLIIAKLFKNGIRSANLASIYIFAIFSYGQISSQLAGIRIAGINVGSPKIVFYCYLLAIVLTTVIFCIGKINDLMISGFIQYAALCLICIAAFSIFKHSAYGLWHGSAAKLSLDGMRDYMKSSLPANHERPDIYYIVLDAYGNASTLLNEYGYDDNSFLSELRQRGFYVGESSLSNYAHTFLSLASSLNMQYLDKISKHGENDARDETVIFPFISNNVVSQFLKDNGYQILHFDSGWAVSSENKMADEIIRSKGWNEIQYVFLRTTILNPLMDNATFKATRVRVLDTFEQLKTVGEGRRKPFFVFSHIVSPHPPFVFEADGSMPSSPGMGEWPKSIWRKRFKEAYIAQLSFINRKVIELVDVLQHEGRGRRIIILQSDHGPAFPDDLNIEPNEGVMAQRMGILNAIYIPDKWRCNLDEELTPVNTFRIIFNGCFDAKFARLEDRILYSTFNHPFKFVDATERLRAKEKKGFN